MRVRVFAVSLLIFSASCLGVLAGNTGQDPTDPVTRFDIRWENVELPGDANNNDLDTIILRTDAPVPLGKKGVDGILAFRMDLPISSSKGLMPGDPGTLGLGSIYLQFLHIAPKKWGTFFGNKAWAWGFAVQAATATNGREEATFIPIVGAKWSLNKPGSSFFTPVLKYYTSPAESDPGFGAISELHLQPVINFNIPVGIDFVTLWGNYDWVLNFEDSATTSRGDLFIPYDIQFGKMLSGGKVVLSATFAGKLVNSNVDAAPLGRPATTPQFDKKFLLRVGFFF
jgi:hypothetical protein